MVIKHISAQNIKLAAIELKIIRLGIPETSSTILNIL